MYKHRTWGERGNEIVEFLRQREQLVKPPTAYISHFTTPPLVKNFLDRERELAMLQEWFKDEAKAVGALVGIGGQGKTYLAAKLAGESRSHLKNSS